jgi:hypothetical protein
MQTLSLADFSDYNQHPFPVSAGGARITLTLTQVTEVKGGIPGGRKPFSLIFRGPAQPLLPQAMYDFEHPLHGVTPIFIVPLAADADGVTYEAVFS